MSDDEDLGFCTVIIDESTEAACCEPAHTEILIRNPFGLFVVGICVQHKLAHNKYYEQKRQVQPGKRRYKKRAVPSPR